MTSIDLQFLNFQHVVDLFSQSDFSVIKVIIFLKLDLHISITDARKQINSKQSASYFQIFTYFLPLKFLEIGSFLFPKVVFLTIGITNHTVLQRTPYPLQSGRATSTHIMCSEHGLFSRAVAL